MIVIHRITHPNEPLHLNPDLIQTVEANPDTVVSLTNASRFVVAETPEEITQLIRTWRASVIVEALRAPETDSGEDRLVVLHEGVRPLKRRAN
jgi:flagellar protein FlbD